MAKKELDKATKKSHKIKNLSIIISVVLIIIVSLLVVGLKYFSLSNRPSIVKATSAEELSQASASNSSTIASNSANIKKSQKTASQSAEAALLSLQNSGPSVHVPILYYHYIGDNPNPADKARDSLSVSPVNFDEQMNYLSSHGYTPILLDTLYAGLEGKQSLPARPIILTFDDGYIDFYLNAYPILRKYGFHAVSFIPTGLMDQGYYLHWNQIREMDSSGLISFQAHTINHVNLPSLPNDKALYQMSESKRVLEAQLGKPVNFLAYPYGTNDGADWQLAKQAGFVAALGTWYGETESQGLAYDWPRIKVGNWTGEQFGKAF